MRYLLTTILLVFGVTLARAQEEKKPPKITFDDHVKPIFQQKCFSCHNPDKKSADLDLTTYTNLMQGGASGAVIEPGDASASYLYELVTHEAEPFMPPESPKIADEMIETLRKWIDGGVLENSGSTAKASKKKKIDLALSAPSTERPEVIPAPARLSLQPVLYTPDRTAVDALATSPWAPLVAVSSQKQVLLYHTQSLELLGVLPFPEGTPRVLKFSRNGALLLAGGGVAGASGRVVVWDIRSGERIIEIGDELDEVLAADISSDQTLIALGGPQKVVRIYATDTGQLMHEIRKHTDWVTSIEFSPDSVLLASGDRNGGLFVWEGWTGREYLTLKGHTAGITGVSWRSDSNILASSSEDSTIRLWEMENGGQVKNWGAHGGGALSVEFTRDGRLVSSGRDRVAKLWDQNGGQQLAFEPFADLALEATFCDEAGRAISGDWTGEIRVWNAADGARLGLLPINAPRLEDRLAQANEFLVAKQNEHNPIAEAYRAAQSTSEKAKADWTAAQQKLAMAKQTADAAAAALAAVKQSLTQTTAQLQASQQQAEQLKITVPALKEAADKAAAAVTQVSDDQELAAAAQTIKAKAQAKEQLLVQVTKTALEQTALVQKYTTEMQSAEKAVNESTAALAMAESEQQKLMPMVEAAEKAATAAQQVMEQSSVALAQAQQQVARWNDEIEFSKKLENLKTQRTDALTQLNQHEERLVELQDDAEQASMALNQANSQLVAMTSELSQREQDYERAIASLQASQKAEAAAAEAAKLAMEQSNRLEQVSASVAQAAAKADEALALAKEDPSLVALSTSLKELVAQKTQSLEAAKADLVSKTQAHQMAATKTAADNEASKQIVALRDTLKKQIADQTAKLAPLTAASEQAAKAVEAQAALVAQTAGQLESIREAIAVTQGIKPGA